MLYELEVLEAGRIADLAGELRRVRDRMLEKVKESQLGEPPPARGEHNPVSALDLEPLLTRKPEFAALRDALDGLPRDIRHKLWAVAQTGGARAANANFDGLLAQAAAMGDAAVTESLLGELDLQLCLRKGLYQLGITRLPGDAGAG